MNTPWGMAQTVEKIADGITSVSTASHGGLLVSPERLAKMPAHLLAARFGGRTDGWFEEDCEWARVALAFPECFPHMSAVARIVFDGSCCKPAQS